MIDSQGGKNLEFPGGLDALCGDCRAEVEGHQHDGGDEGPSRLVGVNIGDQGPVELDDIREQFEDVAEGEA